MLACPLCANRVLTRRSKSTASLPSPMLINCTQTELDATGRRSRLGTWPTRNGLMPAGQVGELRSYFYVCQTTADADCDQCGDVGDRETVASDKLLSVQLTIHPFESLMRDPTLRFTVVRELLITTLKDRTRILNRPSD